MVSHYNQSPRKWTKKAWIDLKDNPTAQDLGYRSIELGVSRKKEGTIMLFNSDPESNGREWLAADETVAVEDLENVR